MLVLPSRDRMGKGPVARNSVARKSLKEVGVFGAQRQPKTFSAPLLAYLEYILLRQAWVSPTKAAASFTRIH